MNSSPVAIRHGLSPLARGTLFPLSIRRQACRFIPAGAGNTLGKVFDSSKYPVYPRWRGEHTGTALTVKIQSGLSPLARGTRACYGTVPLSYRFIPAGAGNTDIDCSIRRSVSVYPRWRGEHSVKYWLSVQLTGLSPLARGTQFANDTVYPGSRFIPAGAGNTEVGASKENAAPVYPRWRGEHQMVYRGETLGRGLSPLARGTL